MGKIAAFVFSIAVCSLLFIFWVRERIIDMPNGNEARYDILHIVTLSIMVTVLGIIGKAIFSGGKK